MTRIKPFRQDCLHKEEAYHQQHTEKDHRKKNYFGICKRQARFFSKVFLITDDELITCG